MEVNSESHPSDGTFLYWCVRLWRVNWYFCEISIEEWLTGGTANDAGLPQSHAQLSHDGFHSRDAIR